MNDVAASDLPEVPQLQKNNKYSQGRAESCSFDSAQDEFARFFLYFLQLKHAKIGGKSEKSGERGFFALIFNLKTDCIIDAGQQNIIMKVGL